MILRGIPFGNVWVASGTLNHGDGWWYHPLLRPFGLNFDSSTLTTKTVTYDAVPGNMPLREDGLTPKERFPKCIWVNQRAGVALNAVGLSNFGLPFYLAEGYWQKRTKPFFISVMAVGTTHAHRLAELRGIVHLLLSHKHEFAAPFGIQLNVSCPNHKVDFANFIREIREQLDILAELGVPVAVKFAVTTEVATAAEIATHLACDAVVVSNTIPFGTWPDKIDWKKLCGSETVSPLEKRLGPGKQGGLSGAPLFKFLLDWVWQAQGAGFPKPICAGGGILRVEDVLYLASCPVVEAVSLGSVAFLRPWRVKHIIEVANRCKLPCREP